MTFPPPATLAHGAAGSTAGRLLVRVGALGASLVGLIALSPAQALAQECDSDADCPSMMICEQVPCAIAACPPGEECPEPDCPPGECVDAPFGYGDCETDSDCPGGFTCQEVGGYGGSVVDTAACPPGEECPEPEPADPPEPVIVYGCQPAPCDVDSDCPSDLVCLSFDEPCDDIGFPEPPPCPPGEDCPEPDPMPEPCEPETVSFCGPSWLGPCSADADCGTGFTCEEAEICTCTSGSGSSGGGSTPATDPVPGGGGAPEPGGEDSDGADTDDPAGDDSTEPVPGDDREVDCMCEGIGEFYCEPIEVPCTEDADCDGDWICHVPEHGVSVGGSTGSGGSGSAPAVPGGGPEPAPEPDSDDDSAGEEDEEHEGFCIPGGVWGEAIAAGALDDMPGAAPLLGGGYDESANSPTDPTAGGGGSFDDGTSGTPLSTDDSGCQGGGSPLGAGLVFGLALAGAALIRRRERTVA